MPGDIGSSGRICGRGRWSAVVMAGAADAGANSVAWITLLGTLGGVTVTGVLALVNAGRSDRAQRRRAEQQHQFDVQRELRTARLACYVRYIVSAQAVYDRSYDLYVANSKAPIDPGDFSVRLPPELADELTRNETCRVEVLLVAGEPVRAALEDFDAILRTFWREAASGTAPEGSPVWHAEATAYHHLIATLRADVYPTDQAHGDRTQQRALS